MSNMKSSYLWEFKSPLADTAAFGLVNSTFLNDYML